MNLSTLYNCCQAHSGLDIIDKDDGSTAYTRSNIHHIELMVSAGGGGGGRGLINNVCGCGAGGGGGGGGGIYYNNNLTYTSLTINVGGWTSAGSTGNSSNVTINGSSYTQIGGDYGTDGTTASHQGIGGNGGNGTTFDGGDGGDGGYYDGGGVVANEQYGQNTPFAWNVGSFNGTTEASPDCNIGGGSGGRGAEGTNMYGYGGNGYNTYGTCGSNSSGDGWMGHPGICKIVWYLNHV